MSKVVICGVDTSTLPKITEKQSAELLKRIACGDENAREEFIVSNMRLVLSVIKRFWAKKANSDDVFQAGMIGLLKAVDNFNRIRNEYEARIRAMVSENQENVAFIRERFAHELETVRNRSYRNTRRIFNSNPTLTARADMKQNLQNVRKSIEERTQKLKELKLQRKAEKHGKSE